MMTQLPDTFALSDNPLINPPSLPYGAPALNLIRLEHMMPAIDYGILLARRACEAIKNIPIAEATFENTIEAYEHAGEELDFIFAVIYQIALVNGDAELDKLHKEILAKVSHYTTDIAQDEDLFARIAYVYEHEDRSRLTPEQKILLDKKYTDLVREGAKFTATENPLERERLRAIEETLTRLGASFSDNLKKAKAAYERYVDDVEELAGVPERALSQYAHQAKLKGQKGRYLIQLQPYPQDIYSHCTNRKLREEIFRAEKNLCVGGEFDNTEIIRQVIALRHEKAKILGFDNFASYVVADRMTENTDTVAAFLERNLVSYRPAAEQELEEIKAFAYELDGLTDIQPWDLPYYSRQMKEKKFQFSTESLRPYFRLENVLKGLYLHAEKLFGVSLREDTEGRYPVHHPDVKVFEVWDKETQSDCGLLYADYYARSETKKGGAWHMAFQRSYIAKDGSVKLPITTNTNNFPKPSPDKPTLLSVGEVEELFHEFGHALHCLLGRGRYQSLTGTRVSRDFVELPSQLQENWALEEDVLKTYAFHYETGEVIPAHLIQALKESLKFGAGMMGLAQTYLGLLDMAWYTTDPSSIEDLSAFEQKVADRATLFPNQRKFMSPVFAHIFSGGYSAAYHGYKWASVLDKDVFAAFKAEGLYDPELSKRLRDTIYTKGGTVKPIDLFIEMMGRGPDPDALLRSEGLLPDDVEQAEVGNRIYPPQPSGPA